MSDPDTISSTDLMKSILTLRPDSIYWHAGGEILVVWKPGVSTLIREDGDDGSLRFDWRVGDFYDLHTGHTHETAPLHLEVYHEQYVRAA